MGTGAAVSMATKDSRYVARRLARPPHNPVESVARATLQSIGTENARSEPTFCARGTCEGVLGFQLRMG
ncbi:hypothetical protein SKAU_G00394800 [Synaphobranchus kaupii]|uniref:Uncharacterized protein n=1 Tax=Synaphobranchus kaupii TaxID=118154 RepID=A0A9Q1IDY5_SYNKA|nr:hypothetical protein SKAU_G00394800 [Synaphobranchus kaupii]